MNHAFSLILFSTVMYMYMYMYFLPGRNFAPFEEVKVPVSNSADCFPKKCPMEDFGGFGVVRVKGYEFHEKLKFRKLWTSTLCVLLTSCIGGRINMQFLLERQIGERLNACSDLCVFWQEPCQHATGGVPSLDLYTCNRFSESMGSRFGGLGQKALQAMNEFTLFGFLPNPFIQDLFLWRTCTSQEFVKTDLYPLSLITLWYAVCSTSCWSIIGRCVGACQRSNCAEERQPK